MMDKPQEYYDREYMGALLRGFPRPGAKLRYKGPHPFAPSEVMADAYSQLRVGETYTLKKIMLASSWACISLEETNDSEFSLGYFDDLSKSNRNA